MPDAIRTRCKFRVVGVEDTESFVSKTVFEGEPGYEEMKGYAGYEYPPDPITGKKSKSVILPDVYCQNVRLAASYDAANPEDVSFSAATPSGELKIFVSNPSVIGTFRPGKNYYLDLIPCD